MKPQIAQISADEKDPRTHCIIGAAMDVHRHLGQGFLEAVYQEAMGLELAARQIPFIREVELPIYYRGQRLTCMYRADYVCVERVIVELKAVSKLTHVEYAQVLNYLKTTGLELALLFDFGAPSLEWIRLILTPSNLRKSAKSVVS
jgi:GxxExxY protein